MLISLAAIGCKLDLGMGESSSQQAPQAVKDAATTAEHKPVTIAVLANDSNPDGGTLTVTAVSQPINHGQVVINSDQTVTYTPAANFNGTDSFAYTVSNGQSEGGAEVTIMVTAAPTITRIDNKTIKEDTTTEPIPFTIGDVDTPINALTVTATSNNPALIPNANLVLGGSGANRTITATPAANANGSAMITVSVSDGVATTPQPFTVTVNPVNDRPVRTAGSVNDLTINEIPCSGGQSLGLSKLAYSPGPADESGQTLSYTVTQVPNAETFGTIGISNSSPVNVGDNLTLNQLRSLQFYCTSNNPIGANSFAFTVKDNGGTANGGVDTLTESLTIRVLVNQSWVAPYNGPDNRNDSAGALAVDATGNVYVTGITGYVIESGVISGGDYATVKYDANGNQVWVKPYNGPGNGTDEATALAVDAAGNVYVTGYSWNGANDDYATVKYDTNGIQQWERRYNGPGVSDDFASALAVDAAGNVYVGGSGDNDASVHGYATVKYDANGTQQWVALYNSGPFSVVRVLEALAVDAAGNVYVTGKISNVNNDVYTYDYVTVKYDTNSNELWVAPYNGPDNRNDSAGALTVDATGNVYVTGITGYVIESGVISGGDYATVKYDANGKQVWVTPYNGPSNGADKATALAVDATGNVYVTGYSWNGTSYDYATVKYDANGKQVWVARYNARYNRPGNVNDAAKAALAVDAEGNVYVTGYSWNGTSYDYATVKYDANGKQVWVARYNGPGNINEDVKAALVVDAEGNVYVTGSSSNGTNDDYATIKYVQSGGGQP